VFLEQHKKVFDNYKTLKQALTNCEDVRSYTVIQMIQTTVGKLYLFIDFGKVRPYGNAEYLRRLLAISDIFCSNGKFTKVVAVSSGLYAAKNNPLFSVETRILCKKTL